MLQKLIDTFVLKNKQGLPSYSTSIVVYSFLIINMKLIFSGISITEHIQLSPFSGIDYAAALAAISALHVGNKKLNSPQDKEDK